MIAFIQHRRWSYIFSGLLVAASILSLSFWGLKLGIDFTGGSLLEVEFQTRRPQNDAIQQTLNPLALGNIVIQPSGERDVLLRFRGITQAEHQNILSVLQSAHGDIILKRFETVGPTLGSELVRKALWAIVFALLFIIIYIAWAFRKVTRPVASWKYGIAAIVALAHDVLITVGVFSILGHVLGVEVDGLFVSALLTVLGFSVHDTIVVFDRTRENLFRGGGDFMELVNKSINNTLARSINTSLTTLLVLGALFFFGGNTIRYFALALMVGIAIGTYSSIFVASPLLVDWSKLGRR